MRALLRRATGPCLVLLLLAAAIATSAAAEPKPAPRTAIEIGGLSVVLIVSEGKLLAFVDRLDDNAPAQGAQLTITPIGRPPLPLSLVTEGLLTGAYDPGSRTRDSFAVVLESPDGSGQRAAEIVFAAGAGLPTGQAGPGISTLLAVALLSSALGAAVALTATLWYRLLRRRRPVAPARPPAAAFEA